MKGQWTDWITVGLVVTAAVGWLGLRMLRAWRKQKAAPKGTIGCATGCDGCPFAKGCGSKHD